MDATSQSQLERAELETILRSGIFHRAPNLSSFLTYICQQHFAGAGDQIKEYNIAVEALGRSSDFDQKKDSIVRVEAHRLRKRLAEYYAGDGRLHPVRIEIPPGQYAPRFVEQISEPVSQPAVEMSAVEISAAEISAIESPAVKLPVLDLPVSVGLAPVEPLPVPPPVPKKAPRLAIAPVAAAVVALLAAGGLIWRAASKSPLAGEVWAGNSSDPVSSEFRMLAGYHGPLFTDRQGHRWNPDSYFTGGRSVSIARRPIEGMPDPEMPQTMREGPFQYALPLRPGTYELHLYFVETNPGRRGTEGDEVRSFRVTVNGETKLDLFDAQSEAGAPNRLQVRVLKDVSPAKDGKLHIDFAGQTGDPILNALEVLSTTPGRIRPIRIVARKSTVMDADGHVWAADEFVIGGHLVERPFSVFNSRQKNLFEGERFGNFSYHLPVAPGKYRLTLHFAETYFGSSIPNSPPFQKGARLFDVFANGVALLRNFDVGDAAGGPNRGVERTFEDIEPNAQGLIVLEFRPSRNYACINALELEQTS